MSILLIRGFSQSGKDFVGKILCEKYGYQRFAFADSLKQLVCNKYQVSMEQLHSQRGKLDICQHDEKQRTYRQILIDEALLAREEDDSCFARSCCEDIKHHNATHIVITDWRYPKELDMLYEYFSTIPITPIHLIRTSQESSPVEDRSEYQLMDRIQDLTLYNPMDDRIHHEIDQMMFSIMSQSSRDEFRTDGSV